MEMAAGQAPSSLYFCSECRRVFTGGFSAWAQDLWTRSGLPSWKARLPLGHLPPHPPGSKSCSAGKEGHSSRARETLVCRSCSSALEPFSCLHANAEPDPKTPVPACPPSSPGTASHIPLAPSWQVPIQTRALRSHLLVVFPSLVEGQQFPTVYKKLYL